MSFQTRESVIVELRHLLPAGSTVRATAFDSRRSVAGQTRTSVTVTIGTDNVSEAVAIAMNCRHMPATAQHPEAVRGYFGGLSPAQQFVGELALALHGSSTALRLSPSAQQAPARTSRTRSR